MMWFDEENNRFSLMYKARDGSGKQKQKLPSIVEYGEFETINLNVAGNDSPMEHHYLFFLVMKGYGSISHESDIESLCEGDCMIVSMSHRFILSNDSWEVRYFIFNDPLSTLPEVFNWNKMANPNNKLNYAGWFDRLWVLLKGKSLNEYLEASEIYRILGEANQEVTGSNDQEIKDKIRDVLLMIEKEYCSDLKLPELAARTGYSLFYFTHRFRDIVGMTPGEYIIQKRINIAKSLMATSQFTIPEIIDRCGFRTQSNFYHQFRQRTRLTPKQYRTLVGRNKSNLKKQREDVE